MSNFMGNEARESKSLIVREFNNVRIGQRPADGYLNATAMCKAAGKLWGHYWETATAKEFAAALAETIGIPMECLVVTKEGRGGGTWVHPQVGYHLGQWISPAFAVKVTEWISDLHAHGFTTVEGATITAANSREVKQVFGDYMSIARMIGLDKNQAALAANTATVKVCGVNPLEQIGATHLLAPQQEPHLTATQVAEQSGLRSAQAANKKLEECGYQVRELHSDAGWRATPKGERFAIWLDTGKRHNGGAPVRQLRWSASVVPALRADMGASQ